MGRSVATFRMQAVVRRLEAKMPDIIDRLTACLDAPAGSVTETETEKAIRSGILNIQALREALELVDDLGSFAHLLHSDD